MFITVFTTVSNMSLSTAISVEYTLSYPVSLNYILISFFNLRQRVSSIPFLSELPTIYLLRICLLYFCVCVNIYFFMFSLYANLTNFNSDLHSKLRFFVHIYIYIYLFIYIFTGCYPYRSPAYT